MDAVVTFARNIARFTGTDGQHFQYYAWSFDLAYCLAALRELKYFQYMCVIIQNFIKRVSTDAQKAHHFLFFLEFAKKMASQICQPFQS